MCSTLFRFTFSPFRLIRRAHGALSSLADRIKIARKGQGDEMNLSVQYVLNCGGKVAGSCHGGSHSGVYDFIKQTGFIPYDTCQPYLACSSDSTDGYCPYVNTTCSAMNTCKTCNTFSEKGGKCTEIDVFPNATIAEYGMYDLFSQDRVHKIMAEIYARGPGASSRLLFLLSFRVTLHSNSFIPYSSYSRCWCQCRTYCELPRRYCQG